jgi:hypothetical protein
MPQSQTTPTQSQQQPHALIIYETRPELPLEDPPLPSPPQTRCTPPTAPDHMQSKGTRALKHKTNVRSKSQMEQKSSKVKQPLQQPSKGKLKSISTAMTSAHPKFEKGKWMLNDNELCKVGRFCVELHNYYILNWKKIDVIVVKYRQSHFFDR